MMRRLAYLDLTEPARKADADTVYRELDARCHHELSMIVDHFWLSAQPYTRFSDRALELSRMSIGDAQDKRGRGDNIFHRLTLHISFDDAIIELVLGKNNAAL